VHVHRPDALVERLELGLGARRRREGRFVGDRERRRALGEERRCPKCRRSQADRLGVDKDDLTRGTFTGDAEMMIEASWDALMRFDASRSST
jgi:hypothetical protein